MRRGVVALGLALVLVGGLLFLRQALPGLGRIDPAQGASIYQRNCSVCHGTQAEGKDPAPPLNPTGHAHHHPDWDLYTIIADGRVGLGEMPAWKDKLSVHEIRTIIAYIKTLWTDDQHRFQQEVNRNQPAPP